MQALTSSVNGLLELCTKAAPGQQECDNAVRTLRAQEALLGAPNQPVSDQSYFDCLDVVTLASPLCSSSVEQLSAHAKASRAREFCQVLSLVLLSPFPPPPPP